MSCKVICTTPVIRWMVLQCLMVSHSTNLAVVSQSGLSLGIYWQNTHNNMKVIRPTNFSASFQIIKAIFARVKFITNSIFSMRKPNICNIKGSTGSHKQLLLLYFYLWLHNDCLVWLGYEQWTLHPNTLTYSAFYCLPCVGKSD